ncbi:hypothetical protein [Kribbella sp. CA-294648]|uniref:hypothetical protein n=1 Tax=Kribbella sp. CA-294648 TaxID=3239948 RepID=UPI003D8AF96E
MTYDNDNVYECFNNGGAEVGWQVCDFEMVENPPPMLQGWAREDGKDWGWGRGTMADTSGFS